MLHTILYYTLYYTHYTILHNILYYTLYYTTHTLYYTTHYTIQHTYWCPSFEKERKQSVSSAKIHETGKYLYAARSALLIKTTLLLLYRAVTFEKNLVWTDIEYQATYLNILEYISAPPHKNTHRDWEDY